MSMRRLGLMKVIEASPSSRSGTDAVVPLPLRHTRAKPSSERNIPGQNVKIRYRRRNTSKTTLGRASQVEAGFSVGHSLRCYRVYVPFPKQHIVLATYLYLSSIGGIEQHPILDFHDPHVISDRYHNTPDKPASD